MALLRHSLRVLPCSSSSAVLISPGRRSSPPVFVTARRQNATLPPAIAPLFHYAADSNITQAVQSCFEVLHNAGLPWASTIVATGLALRIATSPFHIYAEKLFAKRLHTTNFVTAAVLKKLSEHYRVEVRPNAAGTQLELQTNDSRIAEKGKQLVAEQVNAQLHERGLQASRVQNLRMCTIPFWIFSSFALRNLISDELHPSFPGGLWVPDLLVPDPYFILPVAVGLFGFLNVWAQRKVYPIPPGSVWMKTYDATLAFFTLFAVHIMSQLPAAIPLYWLIVSMSGMAQTQILRHPKVKDLLGIPRLPTDSTNPIRDLFFKKKQ